MPDHHVNVSIPSRWIGGLCVAGAALGFGAAFAVGPVVNWLVGLAGGAPGPLRLVAGLSPAWAIPVLTLVGLGVGFWVAQEWRKENGTITVAVEGVTVHRAGTSRHVARRRVDGVFTDGRDLVVVDDRTTEVLRIKTEDLLVPRLREAFERVGYPWLGTVDPHEHAFAPWIDGDGPLDDRANDLLRTRQRALADKRFGAAADAHDELRALGIAVRDRNDGQQYRMIRLDEASGSPGC